ncbi:hypothetical protein TgHK011_005891 [Trichoderma gracile]|nr:hypothetical protein TgHK011_005891 [Trichoderma gracile]
MTPQLSGDDTTEYLSLDHRMGFEAPSATSLAISCHLFAHAIGDIGRMWQGRTASAADERMTLSPWDRRRRLLRQGCDSLLDLRRSCRACLSSIRLGQRNGKGRRRPLLVFYKSFSKSTRLSVMRRFMSTKPDRTRITGTSQCRPAPVNLPMLLFSAFVFKLSISGA